MDHLPPPKNMTEKKSKLMGDSIDKFQPIRNLLGRVQTNSSKAGLSRAELARCFMLVLFLLVWPDKFRGAGQSRAGAVFYVIVIPISVARQVPWSRAEQSCPDTNRNNTSMKHRASSALLCPSLLLFVGRGLRVRTD